MYLGFSVNATEYSVLERSIDAVLGPTRRWPRLILSGLNRTGKGPVSHLRLQHLNVVQVHLDMRKQRGSCLSTKLHIPVDSK